MGVHITLCHDIVDAAASDLFAVYHSVQSRGFESDQEGCLAPFSPSKSSKSIQDTFYTSANGSVACVAVVDGAGTWQLSSVQMSQECQDVIERRKEM